MGSSSKNVFLWSRAVSWTKASICSGSRLRHQLQIDFITHSNPQLGIANATQLMRRRNPKQVYIDYYSLLSAGSWSRRNASLTPRTFRRDFSRPISALQHFSDFVDQMLAVGSQLTVHTKKRRLEVDEPNLVAARPFLKWATLADHHWPRGNVQWHHYFCDIWQFVCEQQQLTTRWKWREYDDGAILVR